MYTTAPTCKLSRDKPISSASSDMVYIEDAHHIDLDNSVLSSRALKRQVVISCIYACGSFTLGVWTRCYGAREPHKDIRICLPGTLTDSRAPASPVSGVPICLHHHCHGKPPHHSHGDLRHTAPHTHVLPAPKSGCLRPLFLLCHCPKDAGGLPL